MKKTIIGLTSLICLTTSTTTFAMDNDELHRQLQILIKQNKHLTERIQKLENQVTKQQSNQQQKTTLSHTSSEEEATPFLKTMTDMVELSALVEVATNATNDDINDSDTSDINLATVEIGFDAQISNWSSGHILLLYEEGEEDDHIIIDEGTITLGNLDEFPAYLTAGKMYVPFGSFESNMISDPLTTEIGETGDTSVLVGFETGNFYGSAYAFNGDIAESGKNDKIDTYGANIGYVMENESIELDLGLDWINNIGDTNGIGDHLDGTVSGEIADYVDGISIHAILTIGSVSLIGEYVAAIDSFMAAEVAWKTGGAKPCAYNIEAAFSTKLFSQETTFALGYQTTDEAVDLGLVEELYIGSVSMELFPHTNLAIEYSIADDYSVDDGGTGDDVTSATMQLAVEF
jgi:hypothetical protein